MLRLTILRARAYSPYLHQPPLRPTAVARIGPWRWHLMTFPRGFASQAKPGGWDPDDGRLRQIFDNPHLDTKPSAFIHQNLGLFRNRYLKTPAGFGIFAKLTVARSQQIVHKVLSAITTDEYRHMVTYMDRLSDLLCRVLDLCDFVRASHPDPKFQEAAEEAWYHVYQYMNELNTEPGLSQQLSKAMENPDVTKNWTEEEMSTAEVLKMDFIKSAIALPQNVRDAVVETTKRISQVANNFVNEMEPAESWVKFPATVRRESAWAAANNLIHVFSTQAGEGLRTVANEKVRKHLFYSMRTSSKYTVSQLEKMVRLRAQLAQLAGFETYAHLALRDRMMAKSPDNVLNFLGGMLQQNNAQVTRELDSLLREKRLHVGGNAEDVKLMPWDKEYYMRRVSLSTSVQKQDDELSKYFSVGVVIRGLSRLFTRLYGIRFVPADTAPGETWAPEVRRLNVVSDTEGHVAVLYCDLFHRPNKSPNPAHFTVRCSRAILPEEMEEFATGAATAGVDPSDLPQFETLEEAANDGMALSKHGGVLKQLPTVALVCDFPPRETFRGVGSSPALLSFSQVETLFHEMGHAIHSILARTNLQNVAGTRCPTDFAELPSTLLEHFASNKDVLALFAEHHVTGELVPFHAVRRHVESVQQFAGIETERQIILAMLDQKLYSTPLGPESQGLDSTRIFLDLQRQVSKSPPDPEGTSWQGFFGHLYGYGATYYSYLFDRVLAERVWRVVFDRGVGGKAVDREAGEKLKQGILKWGGSRDPWHLLADTLGDEEVRAGDEKAMMRVASWGLGPNWQVPV